MISIRDVVYKDIINYPSIDIEKKITFICGESGCGKTTLLKLINNTISYDKGKILYQNKEIREYEPIFLRREIILASQNVFLFDGTIKENFNKYYEYRNETIDEEEMNKYLKICAIDFDVDAKTNNMSGGERQRIYIAICLSFKPKVIMLDEPTSALDDKTAEIFMNNLISIDDLNVIIVSHDKELAKKYAEEIIYLEKNNERNS